MVLLPAKYLKHKTVMNYSPNTVKRSAFAICYYFHYGERFDRPNAIKNLKDILSSLDYREWEKESIATLNEILKLLRGHYTYVNSLVSLDKLKKEQQEKKQHPRPNSKK